MSNELSKGRFTKEECDFIKMNCSRLTPAELAAQMNRHPDSIRKYIKKKGLNVRGVEESKEYAEESLISSDHWEVLKERYTESEQKLFKQHYKEIVGQFHNEVPYTELFQIIDYIHIEIEIQRTAVMKRQVIDAISRLNQRITKVMNDDAIEFEDLICQKEASLKTINKDLIDLLNKKESYAKSMRATREQRVQRVEASKKTFNGFIADILANPEKMRQVGLNIEKHRLATDVQYELLHNLHEYKDGGVDPPILNSDSVEKLDISKIEKENEKLEGHEEGQDEQDGEG